MAGRTTARDPELIEFSAADRRTVVTVMRRLLRDHDGWLNLQPAVDPDDLPDEPGVGRLFSALGPAVPLGSWVPGAKRRNGTFEPVSLGLQHAGGPKAILRLREAGLGPLAGWKVLADHPRRGLVVTLPDGFDPDLTIGWLIDAATLLTDFELPARWHAGLFSSHR